MSEIYINEKSLEGQFESFEEFLDNSLNFVRCLEWLRKSGSNWRVLKKSDLYTAKITKEHSFYDLRGYKVISENNTNDILRKLKSTLLLLQNDPPFWDVENKVHKEEYYLNDLNITGSSIAEATAKGGAVLSFNHRLYNDMELTVINGKKSYKMFSIATIRGMALSTVTSNTLCDAQKAIKLHFTFEKLAYICKCTNTALRNIGM